jgi:hypothetical protein
MLSTAGDALRGSQRAFVTGHWIVGAKRFGPSYSLPKVQINKIACVIADVIT